MLSIDMNGTGLLQAIAGCGALEGRRFAAYIKHMAENASTPKPAPKPAPDAVSPKPVAPPPEPEFGGPPGPEPTRYGDWERGGRCIDF